MSVNVNLLDNIREENLEPLLARLQKSGKYLINGEQVSLKGEYFEKQTRIALKNYDIINPEKIEEALKRKYNWEELESEMPSSRNIPSEEC